MKTKTEVLASLAREYKMRQGVYAKYVKSGKMTPEAAQHELECTQAAIIIVRAYPEVPEEPLYNPFIEAYQTFARHVLKLAGAPIRDADTAAAIELIKTMRVLVPGGDAEVLAVWQTVLKPEAWGLLNDFLRGQSTLPQINRNIQEILTKLQNAIANRKQSFRERYR
jgi:hypothetical protein